jgi:hypothetical protein
MREALPATDMLDHKYHNGSKEAARSPADACPGRTK